MKLFITQYLIEKFKKVHVTLTTPNNMLDGHAEKNILFDWNLTRFYDQINDNIAHFQAHNLFDNMVLIPGK